MKLSPATRLALHILGERSVKNAEAALDENDTSAANLELRIAETCRRLVGGELLGDRKRSE